MEKTLQNIKDIKCPLKMKDQLLAHHLTKKAENLLKTKVITSEKNNIISKIVRTTNNDEKYENGIDNIKYKKRKKEQKKKKDIYINQRRYTDKIKNLENKLDSVVKKQ
eukprot:550012_1